ncbi:hypothetical protein CCACVL1_05107 [Corchorus capsularis]|uniref:Uncharacterized protein n=1 Tax=Corchorus capsularis TaxID=210143 RepID=A0A1R3JMJ0_COCAP|nr:hypothetical protein CCACVL1_05107 [Corchorus capsularis]
MARVGFGGLAVDYLEEMAH